MNDQDQTQNNHNLNPEVQNLAEVTPPTANRSPRDIFVQIIEKPKHVLRKFYANKKIFWLTTIPLSLVILTMLIGIIFGNAKSNTPNVKIESSPTPQAQEVTTNTEETSLTKIESRLSELKARIDSLDIKQSRLQPPPVDFDVSF